MNKLMALLFLVGAIAAFGLAQRDSFRTQSYTRAGTPADKVRTVHMTQFDRLGYIALGMVCMAGCLYFIARIRRNDLRR